MAQLTGTYDTYDLVGDRENLTDDIYRVTPTDTPFTSAIGRTSAKGVFHEWQTDSLAAVNTANEAVEGDDFSYSDPAATARVGNYTQIHTKTFLISDTAEVVDKAGRDKESALQTVKKALELKRDIEATCIGRNVASRAGTASQTRRCGSLSTWLVTNDNGTPGASPANRGTSGGAVGFSSGVTTAATDGTTRAFTQAMLDGVIAKLYINSGQVDDAIIMAGPSQKAVITGFAGITSTAGRFHEVKDRTIISTADVYASQFGDMKIVPNRYIRQTSNVDREVYIVRPAYAKLAFLRPMQNVPDLAKTGDAWKFAVLAEVTLKVANESAHGVIADLS